MVTRKQVKTSCCYDIPTASFSHAYEKKIKSCLHWQLVSVHLPGHFFLTPTQIKSQISIRFFTSRYNSTVFSPSAWVTPWASGENTCRTLSGTHWWHTDDTRKNHTRSAVCSLAKKRLNLAERHKSAGSVWNSFTLIACSLLHMRLATFCYRANIYIITHAKPLKEPEGHRI